ncbi:MAG: hypothetical protein ABH842_06255 [Candidatus Micrarchaeota archaeon]
MVKKFDITRAVKDIRKYKIVSIFFAVSLGFFFTGILIDPGLMGFFAIGLIFMGATSIYLTWVQPSFMSEETTTFNIAVATSHSFFFLAFMIGVIFIIDRFFVPITDMFFALLGSFFLSMMVGSIFLAYKLRRYE